MTREEEEIAVAFNDYRDALKLSTFGDFEYIDIQEAFEEGAKWADNHPVNVWHNANEKPRTKEWLLVQFDEDDYDTIYFDNLYIDMWSTWCKTSYVIRWAYISDLLPKQFGNSKQPKGGEL